MPAYMVGMEGADPNATPGEGEPTWREQWLNEIARLEDFTADQVKKGGADQEWYKMMYHRIFRAFAPEMPHMFPLHGVPQPGDAHGQAGAAHGDDQDMEDEEE